MRGSGTTGLIFATILSLLVIPLVSCGGGGGAGAPSLQVPGRTVGNFPQIEGRWQVNKSRGSSTCPTEVENTIMAALLEENPEIWIFQQPEGNTINTVMVDTGDDDGQMWSGGFEDTRNVVLSRPDVGETAPDGVITYSRMRMRITFSSEDRFTATASFRLSITVFQPPSTVDCFVSIPITGTKLES